MITMLFSSVTLLMGWETTEGAGIENYFERNANSVPFVMHESKNG